MPGAIFREQRPDPRRLWVRYRPAPWPAAGGLWLDLGTLGLGQAATGEVAEPDAAAIERLDDLVYLPPVTSAASAARDRLAERLRAAGLPVLVQVGADQPAGPEGTFHDLTEPLVEGKPAALGRLPAGARVLWPWLAGLTDREAVWRDGLERLRRAGVERVAPVLAEPSPKERRRLAEAASLRGYGELFHGSPAGTAAFAAAAHALGVTPIVPRPLPTGPPRLAARRALSGHLALLGELSLLTGRGEVEAQGFFRAARWADREIHDLEGLRREGNLGVLEWLQGPALEAAAEFLERGSSRAMEELERSYLAAGSSPG